MMTFVPTLISFSSRLVNDQSLIGSGVASLSRACWPRRPAKDRGKSETAGG
jgi:hypothetical protein